MIESQARRQLQSAYQILVATSLEKLRADIGDKWDSGRVVSDNSIEVVYRGGALASGERAYWKVRVWDANRQPSSYSTPSFFEMGLRARTDWRASWIAAKRGISSPLLRRAFSIDAPVRRARAYVSGLGWYELSINGQKVGDRVLDPASTTYHDPSPAHKSRVLYSTYDVTDALTVGENVLGVMLGNGWYSSEAPTSGVNLRRAPYSDRPCLILQLNVEFVDGRRLNVVSDGSWKASPGPITYNDLANGETYDARAEQAGWNAKGFDDTAWQSVELAEPPSGVLTAQLIPPSRVTQTWPATKKLTPKSPISFEGAQIYDFGQTFTGWTRIAVSGPRGAKLTLRYASRIYPDDDTLDDRSNTSENWEARQRDTYILKGEGTEIWEPRFTLHGFRYVEVRDFAQTVTLQSIEGRLVRSAVDSIGSFTSSNELLNRIHHNIQWTLMTSLQGIPQDAGERGERMAWLGDPGFVAEDYIYNYDMSAFLEKWLDDICDTQTAMGSIPILSPLHLGRGTGDESWPSWQSTYPLLLWHLYEYYGDRGVLARHYSSLKKLVEFHGKGAKNNLIPTEPLGDHMEPQPNGFSSMAAQHTPPALTATAYYYYNVFLFSRISGALERNSDAEAYGKRAQRIKDAFNKHFFNPATNQYGSGSQASNALPLYLRMVPSQNVPAVMKNLVDDIRKHDTHVTTGIIGSNAIVQALPKYGAADVMYELVNQTTYPSLGEQVLKGATTVCESYECGPWVSQNMKMFASADKFLYRSLAGIGPLSPGYRRALIRPLPVGDLRSVSATQQTVRGKIAVEWHRGLEAFELKVSIPAGMEADIALPNLGLRKLQIAEGSTNVWRADAYLPGVPGLTSATADANSIVFHAGSGTYHFTLTGIGN